MQFVAPPQREGDLPAARSAFGVRDSPAEVGQVVLFEQLSIHFVNHVADLDLAVRRGSGQHGGHAHVWAEREHPQAGRAKPTGAI